MTTETHAILYQSADGTLSLGMKCKTPECAAESVPLFEGAQVLGTVALLPEPVSGMSYRIAAQPPKVEDKRCGMCGFVGQEDPVIGCPRCKWDEMQPVSHAVERLCDFFADVSEVERFMDDLCNVVTELTGDEGEDDPLTVLRRHLAERTATPTAAADAEDAARYRWARDHVGGTAWNDNDYATVTIGVTVPKQRGTCAFTVTAEALDAAIDAARNQEGCNGKDV